MYRHRAIWRRESLYDKLTRVQRCVRREGATGADVSAWDAEIEAAIWQTRKGRQILDRAQKVSAEVERDGQLAAALAREIGGRWAVRTAATGSRYLTELVSLRTYRLSDHPPGPTDAVWIGSAADGIAEICARVGAAERQARSAS